MQIRTIKITFTNELMDEKLYTLEVIKQGFLSSVAEEDWLMSDLEVKFDGEHTVAFDFKVVGLGALRRNGMAGVFNDGLLF